MFGRTDRVAVRRVHHHNPLLRRHRHIHVVDAHPCPRYPAKLAGAGDFDLGNTIRYSYAGWGFGYEFIVAGGVPDPCLPGGAAYEYVFHCEDVGTVVIQLWEDPDYENVADTLIIHIPEPVSVALLSLGGLLLRRRK